MSSSIRSMSFDKLRQVQPPAGPRRIPTLQPLDRQGRAGMHSYTKSGITWNGICFIQQTDISDMLKPGDRSSMSFFQLVDGSFPLALKTV